MIIEDYDVVNGLVDVNTLGDLLKYATQLIEQYGFNAKYMADGHDMSEIVYFDREETDTECKERINLSMAKESLRRNNNKEEHIFWLQNIGNTAYNKIITELNQEK